MPAQQSTNVLDDTDFMDRLVAARRLGADVIDILCMTLAEYGLLQQSYCLESGEAIYSPTQQLAEGLGLDRIGIGVEQGEWIRFALPEDE